MQLRLSEILATHLTTFFIRHPVVANGCLLVAYVVMVYVFLLGAPWRKKPKG